LQTTDQLRLFIALPAPDSVKEAVARAQSDLRKAVPGQEIRWTRPEQFHLTLSFLGKVPLSRVENLITALRDVCEEFAPLTLVSTGIGFFPGARRPRVIWAGVNDANGRLSALWRALQLVTRPFTAEKAEESFSGHITLARVNRVPGGQADALMKAAENLAGTTFGEWTATHVDLMRSELSPQGARHIVLAAVPLAGR
jgi:2'-5' RNA ligase